MIEISRYDSQWRMKIVNETLHFENEKDFEKTLNDFLKLKKDFEVSKSAQGSKYLDDD